MEKEFVPYDLALALEELGFDEPCFAFYTSEKQLIIARGDVLQSSIEKAPTAPLYQQAFRWFREKYDLDYVIEKRWRYSANYNPKETFYTYQLYNFTLDRDNQDYILEDTALSYYTYEKAELECLKKLIEIVKEK